MDSSYVEITELPDVPALHIFLDDLELTTTKHKQLVALLEAINLRSSLNAVRYCTKMLKEKQIMDDTEAYYADILARSALSDLYNKSNAYTHMYEFLRKLTTTTGLWLKQALVTVATRILEANIRLWFSIRKYSMR